MHRVSIWLTLWITIAAIPAIAQAQAPMPKPKPPKPMGFVEGMFADITAENRYRPIADPERYRAELGNLENRSEPQLRTALEDLEKMRRIDGRNWQEIQRARRNSQDRLPLDQPIYVARLYETALQRQREIDRITDEENAAFQAIYGLGVSLKPGFFDPTPQQKDKIAAWRSSQRNEPYDRRRQEVQERFRQRLEEISTEYRNQTDPGEKNLDRIQQDMFRRYQRIIGAQREIRAELDRRHNVEGAVPPEKPNEARDGTLVVSSVKSEYDLKVGEVADIEVTISGGMPSYKVWVKTQETTIAETTLSQPGQTSFPISFPKEGTYTVSISVKDETNPVNEAILTLQIRVTDDRPATPEPTKPPDPTKPQTPPKPPDPTKPENPPPYKPWVLPAGKYQAHLWPGYDFLTKYRKKTFDKIPPIPVNLQVGADGSLAGQVEWKLEPQDTDPNGLPAGSKIECRSTFRLTGKADWTTGKVDLKIVDGSELLTTIQPDTGKPGQTVRYDNRMTFQFDLSGWQIGHPTMEKTLDTNLKTASRLNPKVYPKPLEKNDASYNHMPRFARDTAGKYTFPDIGWCGIPDFPEKGKGSVEGPGGYSRPKIVSASVDFTSPEFLRSYDHLDILKQSCEYVSAWQLRILGQKPPEPPPVPTTPSPAPLGGELAAFGLWPRGEMTAKPGEPFALDAMGVLLNDPYEAVKLNDRVTWNLPDGLTRGADGRITATRPGTYTASVSIKRPDGRTMSDTIRITVR